jgi:hypothetical protein
MEALTPLNMYALRNTNLRSIPQCVQDIISTMQLAPVSQIFKKKLLSNKPRPDRGNWRHAAFVQLKATVLKKDDPDYETVLGLTNKVSVSTVSSVAKSISDTITRREDDDIFRLRVVNLLFSRGVSMQFFSKLMANLFELIHVSHPQVKEDLQASCSTTTFNEMFDMSSTVVYPSVDDPKYDDKLCEWMKKREIRKGFGMFATELHLRGLVDEETILSAIKSSLMEIEESIRLTNDKIVIESVDQLATLMFESYKVLLSRFGKTHAICKLISTKTTELCASDKTQTPCLSMRSRFKLGDISKL